MNKKLVKTRVVHMNTLEAMACSDCSLGGCFCNNCSGGGSFTATEDHNRISSFVAKRNVTHNVNGV